MVMKPRSFGTVARQMELPWQAVCNQVVVVRLTCYHQSIKWIQSPSTELWLILAVYIMRQRDLDLRAIFPKLGQVNEVTRNSCRTYVPTLNFIHLCVFKYATITCRIHVPIAMQPVLSWQPFCAPLVAESSSCHPPSMNLIRPPSTELLQFLTEYVSWPWSLMF